MYQMLCALIAAIAFETAAGHCQAPQAGTTAITFQSSTYADFRQLLARETPTGTVSIRADLEFPEEVRDRYPAVIVVHTLAGYRDANEGYVAAELRKAGCATLTYDSFAARGTTRAAMSASPGYLPTGVADAYAALRRLASEPRVDADRIAIIGFSFGAEVAHLTAFEQIRSALNPGTGRFAAHVPFYATLSFGVFAERGAYTGSPVLMLLGGKDDNLPEAKVESYLSRLRPSRGKSGPDRNCDLPGRLPCMDGSRSVTLRFYPELVSTKKCPTILLGPGGPMFLVDGQTKPFEPGYVGTCMREAPGYSMAFDAAVRAQSIADAIRFLQQNLR